MKVALEPRMLKTLFAQQKSHVEYFFNHLDLTLAEAFLEHLVKCQGTVVMTGVGKSGIVAKKVALTLVSTGSRAMYVDPANALHGDVGFIGSDDVVVMLSKSGESEELLHLIPVIRNKGASIVAWVSKKGSRLEKAADVTVHLPLEKELCPFNLSPTTSPAIQMLFGDVMAVALMQKKQFSLDEYALNHPAGAIGKRLTLKVRDIMISGSGLPLAHLDECLRDRLVDLSDKRCGCLIVVDRDGYLDGILTDGDLRRALQEHEGRILEQTLGSLMTVDPKHIQQDALAWDALTCMESDQARPIMVLPVLDSHRRVVGIVKMHDLIQAGL